jgi:hypothetical protein
MPLHMCAVASPFPALLHKAEPGQLRGRTDAKMKNVIAAGREGNRLGMKTVKKDDMNK